VVFIIIIINSSTFTQFSCFNYLHRCYRCNYYNYFVLYHFGFSNLFLQIQKVKYQLEGPVHNIRIWIAKTTLMTNEIKVRNNYLHRCYRCNYYNYFVLLWTLLMGMSQLVSCMWHKHSRFHICSIFVCGSLWYPNASYVISHFNLICHQCCFSYPDSDIMPFSFGHCVVCPSIYGLSLPLWFLQPFLANTKSKIPVGRTCT
jgi:hypothetical protein